MSFFGNILPFIGDSLGEIASHPLQAAGAALGVPGYDPFFGGLFNNKPGGALLSPTGNFTSSAWQDMYNRNPGDASALNQFAGINSIADKVAPAIAGMFAGPAIGAALGSAGGAAGSAAGSTAAGASDLASGAGATWGGAAASPVVGSGTAGLFSSGAGAGGLTGLFGGPAALGDAGLTSATSAGGSGLSGLMGADLSASLGSAPPGLFSGLLPGGGMSGTASGALGGGLSGATAGAAPLSAASMAAFTPNYGSMMNQGMQMLQGQQQQQRPPVMMPSPQQNRFGGQRGPMGPVGPSMPYATFNQAAPSAANMFGFGGGYGNV